MKETDSRGRNEMLFIDLETERLVLKNIERSDADFIFAQFSDAEVTRYLFDEESLTDMNGADEIIDFYLQPEPRLQHRWIIVRKSDGMKMGTGVFHCWDHKNASIEVGYDLNKNFWGNGYMLEAMQEIIRFARDRMDMKEIRACIYVENQKSINLITKLGFIVKGTMNEVFRGENYLHNTYSLAVK